MASIFLAWLAGQAIVARRVWKQTGGPPMPGNLLATTGLFVALAVLADSEKTRTLAQVTAWGFDIAAFMALYAHPAEDTPAHKSRPSTAKPAVGQAPTPQPIKQV